MLPAGYLIKHEGRCLGERGLSYDYVMAGNGLFLEAENKFFGARIPLASVHVRGLAKLETLVVLRYGKIPARLFDLVLGEFYKDPERERFAAITWSDGSYHIRVPDQEMKAANVRYLVSDNTVLDLHSHGHMNAFFSHQDNTDEQGFQLYGVIGNLHDRPNLMLRIGIYGYHYPVKFADIFNGVLNDVTEIEEDNDDIPLTLEEQNKRNGQYRNRRVWWHRLFPG